MSFLKRNQIWVILLLAALLPLTDFLLGREYRFADAVQQVLILSLLGLGLNVVTGYTGLLNLGAAGFMAIGAYTYAILSCDIYPFQLGFALSFAGALVAGAVSGILLGIPTLRLRGDYLAIVTLGFGEIVQSSIRNLDVITKGSQGINPLPGPSVFGYAFSPDNYLPWYYLFLVIVVAAVVLSLNLERSAVGRAWISVREDELAAACMGNRVVRTKLLAFATGALLCSASGALWACYLGSTGEPGNYDFQISIVALCMVIVGGMGNVAGVLLGALVMVGFNSILLVKIAAGLERLGLSGTETVFASPSNWKFLVFGLALVIMMRYRPEGLLPSRRIAAELRHAEAD